VSLSQTLRENSLSTSVLNSSLRTNFESDLNTLDDLYSIEHADQSIAIVGASCMFPGEIKSPNEYWDLLMSGGSVIDNIDPHDLRAQKHPQYYLEPAFRGGYLYSMPPFDNDLFSIGLREAKDIDPQTKLGINLTQRAIEDAGAFQKHLTGSATGVYVGLGLDDSFSTNDDTGKSYNTHFITGSARSMVANRISHALNFNGPSITVDTACSSSLTALHLACRAILDNECHQAIVGGLSMIMTLSTTKAISAFGALSPTGQIRVLSQKANGYLRSEGGVFLLVKSLKAALIDGNPLYAVIQGTSINSDGRTNPITKPSIERQKLLFKSVCQNAGILPEQVSYIEAHGTGTKIGDNSELKAIEEFFVNSGREQTLYVGSSKGNLGHLEAASGLASVLKAALALRKGVIPKSLVDPPAINTGNRNLEILLEHKSISLESKGVICVNGFGFGGSNASVLLSRGGVDHSPIEIHKGRVVQKRSITLKEGENYSNPIFLFGGAGSEELSALLPQLAKSGYCSILQTVFDEAFCHSPIPLKRLLYLSQQKVRLPLSMRQPLCFAIQVASARTLSLGGIKPSAVLGHSTGEIAAANVSGHLSLASAYRTIYSISRMYEASGKLKKHGLLAVFSSLENVSKLLENYDALFSVASINSCNEVVLSGEKYALKYIQSKLKEMEIRSHYLFDVISHLPRAGEYFKKNIVEIPDFKISRTKTLFHSSVKNEALNLSKHNAFDYWKENVESPVLFKSSVESLFKKGHRNFIDLSPSQILAKHVKDIYRDSVSVSSAYDLFDSDEYPQTADKPIFLSARTKNVLLNKLESTFKSLPEDNNERAPLLDYLNCNLSIDEYRLIASSRKEIIDQNDVNGIQFSGLQIVIDFNFNPEQFISILEDSPLLGPSFYALKNANVLQNLEYGDKLCWLFAFIEKLEQVFPKINIVIRGDQPSLLFKVFNIDYDLYLDFISFYPVNENSSLDDKSLNLDFSFSEAIDLQFNNWAKVAFMAGQKVNLFALNLDKMNPLFSNYEIKMRLDDFAIKSDNYETQVQNENQKFGITRWILELVSQITNCEIKDIDQNIALGDLGLDSLDQIDLIEAIESEFNISLETTIIAEHSTISALSKHLEFILSGHSSSFDHNN